MATLFVDEGKRHGYVVVAVVVADGDVSRLRKLVNELRAPGAERIHFVKESDGRRKTLLSKFAEFGARAAVFHAESVNDRDARAWCLEQLIVFAGRTGAERIVLETDESTIHSDNKILYRRVRELGLQDHLRYAHQRAATEPLLALPDAIAWSFGRGGQWAPLVTPLISEVWRYER